MTAKGTKEASCTTNPSGFPWENAPVPFATVGPTTWVAPSDDLNALIAEVFVVADRLDESRHPMF
jgi:hypothetical protein